jgi:ATP-dependent exoDNAse (exonuclease V) beta subunit
MSDTSILSNKRFRIYKSSAGSGKTFTLVREYLCVVLRQPAAYRAVLAITFTNKAMSEMKERIVKELYAISEGQGGPMLKAVAEETGLDTALLQSNARLVLAAILHDYANFSVQTIDSFTYRLLRNFARDLDLPSRFDVEMDTKGLLARMMDQLMDTIGQDPYITDILIQFTEEKLRDESGWQVEEDVVEVATQIFKEGSRLPLAELNRLDTGEMKAFIAFVRTRKSAYPLEMVQRIQGFLAMITAADLPLEIFAGGQHSFPMQLRKLHEQSSPDDFKRYLESKRLEAALLNDDWYAKSAKEKGRIDALLDRGLRARLQSLREYHDEAFSEYLTATHAYANIHSLAVIRQVEGLIDQHKSLNNLVHISDFHHKVGDFIKQEPPEYIYWRLGEKYRHYLFDEFQDTSVLQWMNLFPLFDYVRTADDRDGSLLLVGDAKQAIYRFRGGDADLLEVVAPNQFDIEPEMLGTNYRSLEYVVDFNNQFFRRAQQVLNANALVRRTYMEFEQGVKPGNEGGGLVQIHYFGEEAKKQEDYLQHAMERLLTEVNRLRLIGYQLRDIAVLVRRATEGSAVARHLDAAGIPVISSDSLLLHKEPVINFIISLFRLLIDPIDGITRAEILVYFYHYLHKDADLDVDRDAHIHALLGMESPVQAIYEVLPKEFSKLRYQLDQLPLYELGEEVVRIFHLEQVAPAYLQQFLDVLLEYSERKKPDLTGFLTHWEEQKGSFAISMPQGQDAVEIMTIHKSKGLQFPVVFIPFATWEMLPNMRGKFWAKAEGAFGSYPDTYLVPPVSALQNTYFATDYEEEVERAIQDNLNLLYVAFTRPEERLYIYTRHLDKLPESPTLHDFKRVEHLIGVVTDDDSFARGDGETYETGIPAAPGPRKAAPAAHVATDFLSHPWRNRIRIERKYRKYWESAEEEASTGEITDGTLMAEVLRQLESAEVLNLQTDRLVEDGILDEARKQGLEDALEAILDQEPIRGWFRDGTQARLGVEILGPGGRLAGPDRLLIDGKAAVLIDFVDRERPRQADKDKLLKYAAVLATMGVTQPKCFWVWLPEGKVEEI